MRAWMSVACVLVALVALAAAWAYLTPADIRGIVRAQRDPIRVISEIGGRIQSIHIKAGSEVRAGDTLIQLETRDARLKLRSLENRIFLARENLASLYRDLEQARMALNRLTISSPVDGRIITMPPLRAGDPLARSTFVAAIIPTSGLLVIESSLPRVPVTLGQRVRLQTEDFPPDEYNILGGTITSISSDRILITPDPYSPPLHPGMGFEVHLK